MLPWLCDEVPSRTACHAILRKKKVRDTFRAICNRNASWRKRVEMMQAWSDRLDALLEGEFTLLLAA
ncbi:hypothetical protein [Blastomonas natatoria]|uniref:hypothetical protein n=1 Tax=Blastomonas natatoria TaxID=34015 RepID=UPI000D750FB1|nr:hypothetical protein [Blastomonas natatoria]